MNKNTFNPVRFIHYLRKDWTENRGQFFYDFIIPYGILTLLFIWIDFTKTQPVAKGTRLYMELLMEKAARGIDESWSLIGFSAFLCLLFYLAFIGSTFFHTSKHRRDHIGDLTFPASDAEKFAARWLRISLAPFPLFALAAVLADFTRIGFIHLLYPDISVSFPMPWTSENAGDIYLPICILEAYALQALFILGATYWRKKPFQKTLSVVLLLGLGYYGIYLGYVLLVLGEDFYRHFASPRWLFGWTYGIPSFLLLSGYVLTYLRMRRASLIVSWKDPTTLALLVAALAGLALCFWMPHHIMSHFPSVK